MSETPAPAAAAAPKKKSKLMLPLIALLVLGGGGGAFWFLRPAPVAAEAEAKAPETIVLAIEPFIVNLADAQASRFLRVSLSLVVDAEHGYAMTKAKEPTVELTRARSAILELLTEQTSDALVTADGKTALKTAIAERANAALAPAQVYDVLFTDFVVQF